MIRRWRPTSSCAISPFSSSENQVQVGHIEDVGRFLRRRLETSLRWRARHLGEGPHKDVGVFMLGGRGQTFRDGFLVGKAILTYQPTFNAR